MNEVFRLVRCPTCDGQSIADSNIEIARYIRQYIVERAYQVQSGHEIREQLTEVFGEQAFLHSSLHILIAALWYLQLAALLAFVFFFIRKSKKGSRGNATGLFQDPR